MVMTINGNQAQRLYAIGASTNWAKITMKSLIAKMYKVNLDDFSMKMVRTDDYDRLCEFFLNHPHDVEDPAIHLTAFMFGGKVIDLDESEINSISVTKLDTEYVPDGISLNLGQYNAFLALQEWYKSGDREFMLDGFAGTGKSFTVTFFLNWLRNQSFAPKKMLLTTCWHRALRILRRYAESNNIDAECKTIYSALGLSVDFDDTGKNKLTEARKPGDDPPIFEYDFIVFDEIGVADSNIHGKIKALFDDRGFSGRILYLGDYWQLPPINEEESLFFDDCADKKANLTQMMRFDGPISQFVLAAIDHAQRKKIFDAANYRHLGVQIKTYEYLSCLFDEDLYQEGAQPYDLSNSILAFPGKFAFSDLIAGIFCSSNYQQDPDFAKVLAFTNDCVKAWNEKIREFIFCDLNEVPEYIPGEILTSFSPIKDPQNSKQILVNNGSELTIAGVEDCQVEVSLGSNGFYSYKGYEIKFKEIFQPLRVVADCDLIEFTRDSNRLKNAAKKAGSKASWGVFYRHWEINSPLVHSYAQTVHKSQGSGYQHVFVVGNDLDKAKGMNSATSKANVIQPRLWYVAASRAKKACYVYL